MRTNPYESPRCNRPSLEGPRHSLWLVWIVPIGTGAAAILGAFTNAINAIVSPEYFCLVMGWPRDENVWIRSVFQGIIEGACYGFVFSLVLAVVITLAFDVSYSLGRVLMLIPRICVGALVLWGLGGVIGVAWAMFDAGSYRGIFPIVPHDGVARFGWVGGSIYGIIYGGFFVVIVAATIVVWRQRSLLHQVASSD